MRPLTAVKEVITMWFQLPPPMTNHLEVELADHRRQGGGRMDHQ
jgi:hypothetical protein